MRKCKVILQTISLIAISSLILSNVAFADVISPKKQTELNITPSKISCKQGLVKVVNTGDDRIACVKPSTAEKLVNYGWAKAVDPKIIEEAKKPKKALGEVKKIAVTKVAGDAGRLETAPRTVAYNFVFEACAFEKTIRAPQVLVSSGSESKTIHLASQILANTCHTSAAIIKAVDPNTIKGTLVNKGGITDRITSFENMIGDLRNQIQTEKDNLKQLNKQASSSDVKSQIAEASSKIVDLRNQLNQVRGELNTYLFALHVKPSSISDLRKPITFEGAPVEGVTVKKIQEYELSGSTEESPAYHVIFEACSPLHPVSIPQVKVTTDSETKFAKLADKIPVGTCQTSVVKIKAQDISTLSFELTTSDKVTSKVSELTTNNANLKQTLTDKKRQLSELIHVSVKPADYEQMVTKLTSEIVDLRNKINANNAQLARYNFQFFE